MATYKTTRETMAYNANNAPRDSVPAGFEFTGWMDGAKCRCSADALPYLKKGWWVNGTDVQLAGTVPPDPEPEPPPGEELVFPDGDLQLRSVSTGQTWRNDGEVRFLKDNG